MICLFFKFGQILKFLNLLIARSPKNPVETLATPDGRRQFQGDTLSVSRVSQYSTLHRCAPPPHRSLPAVFPLSFSEVAFNSFRSPLQQVFPSEYFMSVYLEVTAWSFA